MSFDFELPSVATIHRFSRRAPEVMPVVMASRSPVRMRRKRMDRRPRKKFCAPALRVCARNGEKSAKLVLAVADFKFAGRMWIKDFVERERVRGGVSAGAVHMRLSRGLYPGLWFHGTRRRKVFVSMQNSKLKIGNEHSSGL